MDVKPNDHVLEIGCGPGAGAELICARLETGKLFAIDRSESGVDRTKRRCREYVESGRLTVRQIDLATLRVPVKRLHKVFAFNVNLFWVRKLRRRGRAAARARAPRRRGLPLLRGQPARAGPDHREEDLGGARRAAASGSPWWTRRRPPVVGIIGRR